MTGIDQTTSLWTIVRDDDSDAYQVIDTTEHLIASVPIGTTKQDITRQHYVRDLIVAAPTLLASAKHALAELSADKPNLDACRAMLERAISAARGQL